MANLRDIKRRIRSVKSTAKITRAMQLVAASKMRKAQQAAEGGRAYGRLLAEMLGSLSGRVNLEDFAHPLLAQREVKRRGLLLVTTERGLCGAVNANLFRMLVQKTSREDAFVSIGRKGNQFLARTQRNILGTFNVSDNPTFRDIRAPIEMLLQAYQKGEVDSIELVYTQFINNLTQEPTLLPLVPFHDVEETLRHINKRITHEEAPRGEEDPRELRFEPSAEEILEELLPRYVRFEVFQAILEAKASEHSARMVAMKQATDNANQLIDDLTLQYNKARQAAITQEIIEISTAAMMASK